MIANAGGVLRLVVVLSSAVAGAEDASSSDSVILVDDGSLDGAGEFVTMDETVAVGSSDEQHGFFPELVDGESLTDIGRILIHAMIGAVACTALYICGHAWKHDRFCFSYPHPDDEHEGMCTVARDSLSCAEAEGTNTAVVQLQPDGASV